MHNNNSIFITTLLAFSLFTAAGFGAVNYTYITLGSTPGYQSATPTGLNNAGQVVGYEYDASFLNQALVLWNAGAASIVPMPSGYALAYTTDPFQALAINASGQILAPAKDTASGASVGILFTGGTPAVIGAAPNNCGSTSTMVLGLNAAGHVVGATSGGSCIVFWVWGDGTFKMFQPPEPAHFAVGGIDDADRVIGVRCKNAASSCETGPIFLLQAGKSPVHYKLGANGISAPNNSDQVTGYALAGPGSDSFFWLNSTTWVGIPPEGPLGEQSCCYTNPNNGGYVVFSRPGGGPYAIMHEGSVLEEIAGNFPTNASPIALNDAMQFIASSNLFSPAPGNSAPEASAQVGVVQGRITADPSTGRFSQQVTLTNNGAPVRGPVSLLLEKLSPKVAVYGLSGTSVRPGLTGVAYVDLPDSFGAAGSQATIRLEFIDSALAGVNWTPRVVAGMGIR